MSANPCRQAGMSRPYRVREYSGKGARVAEEARLESVYTSKAYRGFESPSFRKLFNVLFLNFFIVRKDKQLVMGTPAVMYVPPFLYPPVSCLTGHSFLPQHSVLYILIFP